MIGQWLARLARELLGRLAADPAAAAAYLQLAALHQGRLESLKRAEWKVNTVCWLATAAFGAALLIREADGLMSAAACAWFLAVLLFHWVCLRRTERSQRGEAELVEEFRALALRAMRAKGAKPQGRPACGRATEALWVDVLLASAIALLLVFAPPAADRAAWRMPVFDEHVSYRAELGPLRYDERSWPPEDGLAGSRGDFS